MAIPESIRKFVETHGIGFTSIHHRLAYTAQEEAAATHVPGREWAKTVVCIADGRPVLALLPADDGSTLARCGRRRGAGRCGSPKRRSSRRSIPSARPGAMAPFGPLYGQTVFVDEALAKDLQITFHASTHVDAIRMMYADFAKLVHPISARMAGAASCTERRRMAGRDFRSAGGATRFPGRPRLPLRRTARLETAFKVAPSSESVL